MPIITYLTHIRFGDGTLGELPEDLAALGIRRPLVVTDKGIVAAGLVERLFDVAVLRQPAPRLRRRADEPDRGGGARRRVKLYRAEGCDGMIALGGGSPIDLAKGVALLATHPEPLAALRDRRRRRRADHAEGRAARSRSRPPPAPAARSAAARA